MPGMLAQHPGGCRDHYEMVSKRGMHKIPDTSIMTKFSAAQPGDQPLTKRFGQLATAFARQSNVSIPTTSGNGGTDLCRLSVPRQPQRPVSRPVRSPHRTDSPPRQRRRSCGQAPPPYPITAHAATPPARGRSATTPPPPPVPTPPLRLHPATPTAQSAGRPMRGARRRRMCVMNRREHRFPSRQPPVTARSPWLTENRCKQKSVRHRSHWPGSEVREQRR